MIRMLIVDDEHHIVNWLYELFIAKEDSEYEVLKAYSGCEAMQLLKDYKINLILLDITMPGMSGFEVAQKALAQWPDLYIVSAGLFQPFWVGLFQPKSGRIKPTNASMIRLTKSG